MLANMTRLDAVAKLVRQELNRTDLTDPTLRSVVVTVKFNQQTGEPRTVIVSRETETNV